MFTYLEGRYISPWPSPRQVIGALAIGQPLPESTAVSKTDPGQDAKAGIDVQVSDI